MKNADKSFLWTIFLLGIILFTSSVTYALDPGWKRVKTDPVSPEKARQIMEQKGGTIPTTSLATPFTSES